MFTAVTGHVLFGRESRSAKCWKQESPFRSLSIRRQRQVGWRGLWVGTLWACDLEDALWTVKFSQSFHIVFVWTQSGLWSGGVRLLWAVAFGIWLCWCWALAWCESVVTKTCVGVGLRCFFPQSFPSNVPSAFSCSLFHLWFEMQLELQ